MDKSCDFPRDVLSEQRFYDYLVVFSFLFFSFLNKKKGVLDDRVPLSKLADDA
jgi:hypothetical protein